jgi:hypothetical protein
MSEKELDISDKRLVIEMLKYEEQLSFSKEIQELYSKNDLIYFEIENLIIRLVLQHFGYEPSIGNIKNYKGILNYYYFSPTNYDKEVMNSLMRFRENRLLYYRKPHPRLKEKAINVNLLELEAKRETSLYDILSDNESKGYLYSVIAAFSGS